MGVLEALWFLLAPDTPTHGPTQIQTHPLHEPTDSHGTSEPRTSPCSHKAQRSRAHCMDVTGDPDTFQAMGTQSRSPVVFSSPNFFSSFLFSFQCSRNVMRETIILQNPGAGGEPQIQRKQNVNDAKRDQET